MLCKNENEWRRGLMIPDEDYYGRDDIEPKEEKRADLITIHIYKDQIVKLTEDVIRWIFHKIKNTFKRKKSNSKKRKDDAGHNKEEN